MVPRAPPPRAASGRTNGNGHGKLLKWLGERKSAGKLNTTMIDRYCEKIRAGLPPDAVNDLLGIRCHSFWLWKQAGERFLDAFEEGREGDPADALAGYFMACLAKALAEYREAQTNRLHSLAIQDSGWIRWLAIMERRDRPTWGRYDPPGGTLDDVDPDERFL